MSEVMATPAAGERLTGREAALARRRALSQKGKAALGAPAPGPRPEPRRESGETARAVTADRGGECGCQHAEPLAAVVEEAGRGASAVVPEPPSPARQRRIQQSLRGRGDAPPSRPCGRVRPEPAKVEVGTTLSGTPVTGNQVERTPRVTGTEAGSCRTITGTEYIGAEQFSAFCGTVPEPGPGKVAVTRTSRGRPVTGTEVGRSAKVTGDEYGTCKRVTGTEYLAAEQVGEFCGTRPEPRPEKVVATVTPHNRVVTGVDLSRRVRVTGTEYGASRRITGTVYQDTQAGASEKESAPKKVETSHTSAGAAVSGTRVGRSPALTGVEAGACTRVTGTDYLAAEEFVSYCRQKPYQPPAKVGVSATLRGLPVSGTQVGRSVKVTGDEYGACKPVTGSAYIGAEQYAEFCAGHVATEAINRARLGRSPALTGVQPGPDAKLTGAERGLCQPVSGTPYVGEDQAASCGVTPRPLERRGFSIPMPAATARERGVRRITGSAYGDNGRITGPMARALGLISGTPEFRYREDTLTRAVPPRPEAVVGSRITGEGRDRPITGDAWDRGDRVTGTEGYFAQRRNPTLRGQPRGEGVNARTLREGAPLPPAPSRITGSSGNTASGAVVTLSGGARG